MSWTCPKCERELSKQEQRHPARASAWTAASGKKFENHIRVALLVDLWPDLFTYFRESCQLL